VSGFWPGEVEIRGSDLDETIWDDGPLTSDLLIALLPTFRALFLLGYQVVTVNTTETTGSGQSVDWWSLDLQSLDPFEQPLPFDRPRLTFNIAFELEELNDGDELTGHGFGMPLPAEAIGMDSVLPSGSLIPDELQASIDRFVDQAVAMMASTLPGTTGWADRGQGTGMLWLFDPVEWEGIDAEPKTLVGGMMPAQSARASDFVREQVTGAQTADPDRPPHLAWLFAVAGRTNDFARFTISLRQSLQARGLSHAVNLTRWQDLFWPPGPGEAPPWLDVLVELLLRGVILVDGLIERRHDSAGATAVLGSANWEYIPGNAQVKPRMVVVAGRGLAITHDHRCISSWDLELYRVQSDRAIGTPPMPVEPWRFMAADLVEAWRYVNADLPEHRQPWAQVMTQPKPDGLYLLYPVFPGDTPDPSTPPDSSTPVALVIELTVDLTASGQWYSVDVHYYTFETDMGTCGAAHISVWVSRGVTAECNYPASTAGDNNPQAEWTSPADVPFIQPPWRASAELWQAASPEQVPVPWQAPLPVSLPLVIGAGEAGVDPGGPLMPDTSFSGSVHYEDSGHGIDAHLTELRFGELTHDTDVPVPEGLIETIIDLDIGAIPVVGELVNVAEVIYAWQYGVDHWGRPVSNLQLIVMTLFALVPFVSGSFMESLAGEVAGIREAAAPVEAIGSGIYDIAATGLALDEAELAGGLLAKPMNSAHIWTLSPSAGEMGEQDLLLAMQEMAADDPGLAGTYLARVQTATGRDDWLSVLDLQPPSGAGFAGTVLDDSLGRYRLAYPAATDEFYIETAAIQRERAILNGVLRNTRTFRAGGRRVNFPSCDAQPVFTGTPVRVSRVGSRPLLDSVTAHLQAAIDNPPSMWIEADGRLMMANDVTPFRVDLLRADAEAIIGPNFDSLRTLDKQALVGRDLLNKHLVSLEERAYRLAQALVIAYHEASIYGFDPARLTSPEMIGPLRDFVRAFIARRGVEWGPRFELRTALDVDVGLSGLVQQLRFQTPTPSVLGTEMQSGVDFYVIHEGRAYPIQVKATRNPNPMTQGRVWFPRDGNSRIVSVKGPNAVAQVIKDKMRRDWWLQWIPPQGVSALRNPVDPAAAGWSQLGDTGFIVFDDVYMNGIFTEAVRRAAAMRGGGSVNLLTDLPVAPSTAFFYVRMLGKSVVRVDENLPRIFLEALHGQGVLELEDDIAREWSRQAVVDVAGEPLPTKVLFSSNMRLELQNFFEHPPDEEE
jgi:hypothetical protein